MLRVFDSSASESRMTTYTFEAVACFPVCACASSCEVSMSQAVMTDSMYSQSTQTTNKLKHDRLHKLIEAVAGEHYLHDV